MWPGGKIPNFMGEVGLTELISRIHSVIMSIISRITGVESKVTTIENTLSDLPEGDVTSAQLAAGIAEAKSYTDTEVAKSKYTLPVAGDALGGVKNGGNVTVEADGTMTAPTTPAYTLPVGGSQLGGVKNGGNVTIETDGTMTAPTSPGYSLPTASATTLGGIKVGSRLSIGSDGTLSADVQSSDINVATADTLGGVKAKTLAYGSYTELLDVQIDTTQNLKAKLNPASYSTLGGVKVGSGLSIDSGGTLSTEFTPGTNQSYMGTVSSKNLTTVKIGHYYFVVINRSNSAQNLSGIIVADGATRRFALASSASMLPNTTIHVNYNGAVTLEVDSYSGDSYAIFKII